MNLSASNETVGKDEYREMLVKSASARTITGYIYSSAGEGESSQDLVFGGHNIIAENGTVLTQAKRFRNGTIYGDVDVHRLLHERRRMSTFQAEHAEGYQVVPVPMKKMQTALSRTFGCMPFVPGDKAVRE